MSGHAETAADTAVREVEDDPARRRALAEAFYRPRAGRPRMGRFRRAELSFLDWQLRRGVLAPLDRPQPGSPWWRSINARLLRDAWEARYLAEAGGGAPSGTAVVRWGQFLSDPTPRSWYRAHNTSISEAYRDSRHLAARERPVERFFIDVTLARLLFVHAMVVRPRLALGRYLWPIGPLAGDPRTPSVGAYLSLRNVVPDSYPLEGQSITEVLDAENFWGRLIDYGVLLPRVRELYEFAAADLGHPHLRDFIADGCPAYAWPADRGEVWTQRRYRRLGAVVRGVANA